MSKENAVVDASVNVQDDKASFADLLLRMGAQKRLVLGLTSIGCAGSVVLALLMPRYYTASTLLLAPQAQQSSAAGLIAQLTPLVGMAGGGGSAKTPDEMFVALMRTRRLRDALIERLHLRDHYHLSTNTDVRVRMGSMVTVASDKKTGLISIEVDDEDPQFAALLANAHVEELGRVMGTLAVTEAQQRRQFYEQQVARTRGLLTKVETEFRTAQAKSGLVISQALAEAGVKAGMELRTQIANREVQLQALQRFATNENPAAQKLLAEIRALRSQLSRIEHGSSESSDIPNTAEGLDAVRAFRDMKVQEATLEALIRQLEVARMDESREGQVIQQVDPAVPPERPSKPKRVLIVGLGTGLSFVMALLLALLRMSTYQVGPEGKGYWARFKAAWF